MSQIEVPDWVVEVAQQAYYEHDDTGSCQHAMLKAITAALGAWVVPVAVSREHDASRPSFYDVVPNDSQEAEMWAYALVPLYTLRQEKPDVLP